MTPPLPNWIREEHVEGYVNVYQLCPEETRLYGTESLYGDWEGRVLALAQDFYPSSYVEERIAQGHARPYSHNDRAPTNRRLVTQTTALTRSDQPEHCGILYGSALACQLRADGKKRGALPNRREAMRFGRRSLEFVLGEMPNVRAVVCLGKPAWQMTAASLCIEADRRRRLELADPHRLNGLSVFAAHHPVSSVTNAEKQRVWEAVAMEVA